MKHKLGDMEDIVGKSSKCLTENSERENREN